MRFKLKGLFKGTKKFKDKIKNSRTFQGHQGRASTLLMLIGHMASRIIKLKITNICYSTRDQTSCNIPSQEGRRGVPNTCFITRDPRILIPGEAGIASSRITKYLATTLPQPSYLPPPAKNENSFKNYVDSLLFFLIIFIPIGSVEVEKIRYKK